MWFLRVPIMRKYWKLLVFSFAAVSFSLLVFYKHQYDRMVDALQVLDTFGSPLELGGGAGGRVGVGGQLPPGAGVWQAVSSALHVYSAVPVAGGAALLAVSTDTPLAGQLTCWLWLEEQGPLPGRVALHRLTGPGASFTGWLVNCTTTDAPANGSVPYAVGLADSVQARLGVQPALVPLTLPAAPSAAAASPGSLGVCVEPEPWQPTSHARLAEFAAFHSAAGVSQLWLYEPVAAPRLLQLLRRWGPAPLSVHLLSWQFPVALHSAADRRLARHLLLTDCLTRAAGHVQHLIALNVSQYVVPRSQDKIQDVYLNIQEQLRTPDIPIFTLTQEVFCTDAADGVYASHAPYLLINTKTQQHPHLSTNSALYIHLVRPADGSSVAVTLSQPARSRPINPTVMAVHLYTVCGPQLLNSTVQETAAVRHKSRTANSPLYITYRNMRDQALLHV